jgi:hypothetical protein
MSRSPAPSRGNYRAAPPPTLFDRISRSASIPASDGIPDVSDLPSDLIEQFGQPYLRRHFLLGSNGRAPGSTSRFHEILRSDSADLHDHPWDFVTVILSGRYIESTPEGEQQFGPGSVLIRKAEQMHRLTLPDGPVWTYITVGPVRRRWGFSTDDGWVHWSDYLEVTEPSTGSTPIRRASDV